MDNKGHNFVVIGILAGIVIGVLYGVIVIPGLAGGIEAPGLSELRELEVTEQQWVREAVMRRHAYRVVELLGMLFITALRMLVIPLVFFSMVCGIAMLGDIRNVGRTGLYTVIYYMVTTGIAVVIGMVLVNIIQPGVGADIATVDEAAAASAKGKEFSFYQVLEGLVTPNILDAMANTKVLPVIIFSLVFGGILTTMGERGKAVLHVAEGCNEAIMKFVMLVIYAAPIGVFGLVASKVGGEVLRGDLYQEIARLGKYALTVIAGLGVHGLIVLPLILFLMTGRNPLKYLAALGQALLTAFSTGSSSATLPVTMDCAEHDAGVNPRAVSFVCPLGATINMDGTAMYEAVAVMFVAQGLGLPLTFGQMVIVFLTATLAAIGAAGIPQAGLVTMVLVFEAVGIDPIHVGTILSIDWFLDRCRTTVNVWGDACGAAIIDNVTGES